MRVFGHCSQCSSRPDTINRFRSSKTPQSFGEGVGRAKQIRLSPDLPPSQASARPSPKFEQHHSAWRRRRPCGVGFRPTDSNTPILHNFLNFWFDLWHPLGRVVLSTNFLLARLDCFSRRLRNNRAVRLPLYSGTDCYYPTGICRCAPSCTVDGAAGDRCGQ